MAIGALVFHGTSVPEGLLMYRYSMYIDIDTE